MLALDRVFDNSRCDVVCAWVEVNGAGAKDESRERGCCGGPHGRSINQSIVLSDVSLVQSFGLIRAMVQNLNCLTSKQ